MSAKSLRNQLLAAIAMVLVATIALGSSTYAWFVSNNTVKADGLTVQATAEAGLLIRHGEGDYSTSATGNFTTAKELYPTSTVLGETWFHASAEKATAHDAVAGSMKTLTGIAADSEGVGMLDGKAYYISDSFDIYTTGSASDLKISNVLVTNSTAGKIDESLRILVVCGEKKFVIAPLKTDATTKYTVGANPDGQTQAGVEATAFGSDTTGGYSSQIVAETVGTKTDAPTTVQVYVYYEGEDAAHFTDNFVKKDLAVTLTFEATVEAATTTPTTSA